MTKCCYFTLAHRIRRDSSTLTTAQKCDFIEAFKKYKADTSTNGFWAAGMANKANLFRLNSSIFWFWFKAVHTSSPTNVWITSPEILDLAVTMEPD